MKHIELSAQEFKTHLKSDDRALLLDVREEYEFEDENIGGINMPMGNVLAQINDLRDNTAIFICCKSGKRSNAVAYHLAKQLENCKVYSCAGGLEAYKQLHD